MKKLVSLLFLAPMLATSVAFADYLPYIDLGFGYTSPNNMPSVDNSSSLNDGSAFAAIDSSETNYGGRIAIGILFDAATQLSYGLEAEAASYGSAKYSDATSSIDFNYYGLGLLGVAQWNLDKTHLFVKAGATDESLHVSKSNITRGSLDNNSKILPEVGAGIAYSLTKDLQFGLSYYHVFGDDVSFDSSTNAENLPSIDMALLEFSYFI